MRCSCNTNRIWSGSSCTDKQSYNTSCTSSFVCNENYGLACISSICDCNSTQFWNGTNCQTKRAYNETCLSTYWCNTATNNLNCLSQSWANEPYSGYCRCTSSQYYDTTNKICSK